jgi:hypothetical protein
MSYLGRVPAAAPIDADDIPDNSITAAKIVDGAIAVADIADDAITSAKIATLTADLSFNDNVKANFGASDDLEIYHSGSHSVINDTGTGNLQVRANNLSLGTSDNSENYIQCIQDSTVKLYYNGLEKLSTTTAGVTVTGEVKFTNWTLTETGGVLYFATGGTNKMKLDASGNLTCVGDVTAFGTI